MAYPLLAATLGAMDGVKNTPTDAESASAWPAVDRQTRNWLVDFLSTLVDTSTGKIKSDAFGGGSLPTGSARGSEGNLAASAQREILQGSVSTPDLRDQAVSSAKLAPDAVNETALGTSAVTTAKLADAAVTADKLAVNSVTDAQLADSSVVTSKLAEAAVTTPKLADGAVSSDKLAVNAASGDRLPNGTSGQILLHNGTSFVATSISGALSLSSTGVAAISLTSSAVSFVRIAERVASGTAAGASAAASWSQRRGVTTAWVIEEQTGATVASLGASGLINLQVNGIYLVLVSIPGYSVGSHKGRLTLDPVSGPNVEMYLESACAGPGTMTHTQGAFLVSVTGASAGTPATLAVDHWTELVKATNGLGLPATTGDVERYARVELLQLQAA